MKISILLTTFLSAGLCASSIRNRKLQTNSEDLLFEEELEEAKYEESEQKSITSGVPISNTESPLYFIMHVGPPKTGTTTIQCAMKYLDVQNQLSPLNIHWMPRHNKQNPCNVSEPTYDEYQASNTLLSNDIMWCLRKYKPGHHLPRCWNKYIQYFQTQANLNRHIIISDEKLAWLSNKVKHKVAKKKKKRDKSHSNVPFWNEFIKSLPKRYNLQIIVTYRRYFDYFTSYYNNVYRGFMYQDWPNSIKKRKGGKTTKPPKSFKPPGASLTRVIEFFQHEKITVNILNMDRGQLIDDLLCEVLPEEMGICSLKEQIPSEFHNYNIGREHIWCDIVAVNAFKKGLISSDFARKTVVQEMMDYLISQDKSCYSLAYKCPDEKFYKKVFKKSLDIYQDVIDPTGANLAATEQSYKEGFEAVAYKFCTVDSEKVLEDQAWIDYFSMYSN